MKKLIIFLAVIGLGVASLGMLAFSQGENAEPTEGYQQEEHRAKDMKASTKRGGDIEKLYDLVRQARADLEALRKQAGIRREVRGEHGEGRRREGRGEHGEGRREGRGEHGKGRREGRGEHGEGRGESGDREEGGKRLRKNEIWNQTRKGARLILAYNAPTQSFKGTVKNTTSKTLSEVRVEVHLSNGVELGPTKRVDLKPGAKIPVELSAANQKFTWWTTHPEHGSEEGHGSEDGEGSGEQGKVDRNRPKDSALRPLYNQILLLRQEIKILARGLQSRKREKGAY